MFPGKKENKTKRLSQTVFLLVHRRCTASSPAFGRGAGKYSVAPGPVAIKVFALLISSSRLNLKQN